MAADAAPDERRDLQKIQKHREQLKGLSVKVYNLISRHSIFHEKCIKNVNDLLYVDDITENEAVHVQ